MNFFTCKIMSQMQKPQIHVFVCVLGGRGRKGGRGEDGGEGRKYSWHNIIGRRPYGKLAASYLSLSSLEAKISTWLFVPLSWTPTTVIGLIIKTEKINIEGRPAGTDNLSLQPSLLTLSFCVFVRIKKKSGLSCQSQGLGTFLFLVVKIIIFHDCQLSLC